MAGLVKGGGRERDDRRRGTSIDRRVATASRVARTESESRCILRSSFRLDHSPSVPLSSCPPRQPISYPPAAFLFSRLRHVMPSLSLNSAAFLPCVSSFFCMCFSSRYSSEYNCPSILRNVFFQCMRYHAR